MLKIFHSRVCRQPPTQHLYSELVPEGTFQKQQACPAQTTQRHGSSMQFHFCHGQPLPETPPASAVTREGPAWQVRAAGQGAASSTDPGFLTRWPSEEQRRAERSTSTTGLAKVPPSEAPAPVLPRAPESALRQIPRFLGRRRAWDRGDFGSSYCTHPRALWGNRLGGPGFQILSTHPNHGSVPHPCPNP